MGSAYATRASIEENRCAILRNYDAAMGNRMVRVLFFFGSFFF